MVKPTKTGKFAFKFQPPRFLRTFCWRQVCNKYWSPWQPALATILLFEPPRRYCGPDCGYLQSDRAWWWVHKLKQLLITLRPHKNLASCLSWDKQENWEVSAAQWSSTHIRLLQAQWRQSALHIVQRAFKCLQSFDQAKAEARRCCQEARNGSPSSQLSAQWSSHAQNSALRFLR